MKYVLDKRVRTFKDRLTTVVASAAILANSAGLALPILLTQRVSAAPTVSSQVELVAAIASSETVINLGGSFTVDSKISINRPLVLNGHGYTITSSRDNRINDNNNNAVLGIDKTSNVTINNLSVDRGSARNIHGINVWLSTATLNSVTISNFSNGDIKYGLLVGESSNVTVNNIRTFGNSRGINVDKGTPQLIVNGQSQHSERLAIYTDKREPSYVVDNNDQYERSGVFLGGYSYSLKPIQYNPSLNGENFNTVSDPYRGISVGFNAKGFSNVTSVEVEIERTNGGLVKKTANSGVINSIKNNPVHTQHTAPFVIVDGSYSESIDLDNWSYTTPSPATWDKTTVPTKAIIRITDEHGTKTAEINNFSQGNPSWPTYESLLPVDSERPTATLTNPTSFVKSDFKFIIEATDNDELAQIVANIYEGCEPRGALLKSTQSSASGQSSSHQVNLPSTLSDDTYGLLYNAKDSSGNTSITHCHTFTIDTTNPRISDAKISEDIVNSTATPTLSATVDGTGSNVASAQYRIHTKDGSQVAGFSWVDMQAEDGYFDQAIEGITSPVSIAGLTDGEYIARIRAFDEAGNKKSGVDVGFTVDNTAPNITWQKQPDAIYGMSAGFHVRPITSEVGTTKSVYIDSVAPENLVRTLTSDHKNFDVKNTDNQALWDSLVDGEHVFIAVFTDYAGNTSTSASNSFVIDRTGPTVTVKPESIGADGVYQNVSFKLFDQNQVDKLTLNGVLKDLTNNNWSDLNGVKPGVFGAVEGINTLVVYDVAGNSTTYVFTLDTTPPTVIDESQVWEDDKGRTSITLTFSEPVTGLPQGWYGSGTTWTKAFYNTKEHDLSFADVAGNIGTYSVTPIGPPPEESGLADELPEAEPEDLTQAEEEITES